MSIKALGRGLRKLFSDDPAEKQKAHEISTITLLELKHNLIAKNKELKSATDIIKGLKL
ncbi:MAG: hypothetical protein AB8F78_05175 [Saprospiraceae bacterium]